MSESPAYTYKLTLAYDGTNYGGWQIQPNAITIQQLLNEALSTFLRQPTYAVGSGRTDAGVHALAQCAHFHSPQPIDVRKAFRGLNGILPQNIRVLSITPVEGTFHARYSAVKKFYRYQLTLGPVANPFTRLYSWHISFPLDMQMLHEAAKLFIGTHDFRSFANIRDSRHPESDTIRTLYQLDIIPTQDGVHLEFIGDGFLYKMVRNITGCLIEVAKKKRPVEDIPRLLSAQDRTAVGAAAPAHGLFLVDVIYPESL